MQIVLERNQKHGAGYQIRIVGKVWDAEPLTITEAIQLADVALKEINEAAGTAYKLCNVLTIDAEALNTDSKTDFTAALLNRNLIAKKVNGEMYLSPVGVMLMAWKSHRDGGKTALLEFCRVCASRGVGGGATALHGQIMGIKDEEQALAWISDKMQRGRISGDDVRGILANL